jgi:pyrroloquinoline quinone (PQQ) biosynthesis protein C
MFPHTLCHRISHDMLLIAASDGECWLRRTDDARTFALPKSRVAASRSSPVVSAVEGAITAGLQQTGCSSESTSYTLPRYVRWLASNYLFAGTTPCQFRRAAERFEAVQRNDLAEFARKKAAEEEGHAELAFRDLEDLGLPAMEVIELIRPPSAAAFADRFANLVESDTPVALFGFSYCLERMAVERDDAFVETVRSICPPQSRAIRFLKVHSNVGSDGTHVDEQLSFFESLTQEELELVIGAAFGAAVMLGQQPAMNQALTDVEICRRLASAGVALPDAGPGSCNGHMPSESAMA